MYFLITKKIQIKVSQELWRNQMDTSNNYLTPQLIPLKGQNSTIQTIKMGAKRSMAGDEDEQNLLQESKKIIEQLYEMRLIQKISRPISKKQKEELVEKFAGKMEILHRKLDRIRVEVVDKVQTESANNKYRSGVGSATYRPLDWKKSIKAIQNRYSQVLYEGSFKHYPRLNQFYDFAYPLQTIKIEEWSSFCLKKQEKQQSCC